MIVKRIRRSDRSRGSKNGGKRKGYTVRVPPPVSMELRPFLVPLTNDRIRGTGTCSMVRAHLCDRRLCNTCLYPSTGGVRACQIDDEKELVHSRYPREVEGIRAGIGGWTRGEDRTRERGRESGSKWKREEELEGAKRDKQRGG